MAVWTQTGLSIFQALRWQMMEACFSSFVCFLTTVVGLLEKNVLCRHGGEHRMSDTSILGELFLLILHLPTSVECSYGFSNTNIFFFCSFHLFFTPSQPGWTELRQSVQTLQPWHGAAVFTAANYPAAPYIVFGKCARRIWNRRGLL